MQAGIVLEQSLEAKTDIDAGETRFTSTINVTVLTSDILDEVVIEPVKEYYMNFENVEFEAYFGTEEEKETSVISSVNTQDLSMNLKLGVKKAGYLKDGKIEILEAEEGNGLNFKVKEGLSVIPETCGYIVCNVIDKMETATHTVFLGEVIDATVFRIDNPNSNLDFLNLSPKVLSVSFSSINLPIPSTTIFLLITPIRLFISVLCHLVIFRL